MYYYKTTVRLNGNTMNEVVKVVTAPEFLILRYIHGIDALYKVKEVRNERIDLIGEKERLHLIYSKALNKKKQSVDSIFGALGNLPDRLPDDLIKKFNINEKGLTFIDPKEIEKAAKIRNKSEKDTIKSKEVIKNQESIVNSDEVNVADLIG